MKKKLSGKAPYQKRFTQFQGVRFFMMGSEHILYACFLPVVILFLVTTIYLNYFLLFSIIFFS